MPRRFFLLLFPLLLAASLLPAAAPPPPASPTAHGDRLRDAYFLRQAKLLGEAAELAEVRNKDDWERKRPEMRRQFLDMMGLWPLPSRTKLNATVTGTVDAAKFTIEKLHYQSVPGLYVSANLYVPKK